MHLFISCLPSFLFIFHECLPCALQLLKAGCIITVNNMSSWVQDTKRTWLTKPIKHGSQELTETLEVTMEPTWVYNRSCTYTHCCLVRGSCGTHKNGSWGVSESFACSWNSSPSYWVALPSLDIRIWV